jgi:pimeloyl-ACP methyl ester carboxylesterase
MIESEEFGAGETRVILLHEGLGSLSTVRGFAAKLPFSVMAYSRYGYGNSSVKPLPWGVDYMHEEADIMHQFAKGAHLIGHSDGASIAAIYASRYEVASLTLIAPHFVVEDVSIVSIKLAKIAYETGDLKAKLARHHANPDNAFYGWNNTWLSPEFRDWSIKKTLETIVAPVLIIQGEADQYGTYKQIEIAKARLPNPPEVVMLSGVGHNPMREAEGETLKAITNFIYPKPNL